MAIYHLHIDSYRRSRGRSAIGGAAYRRGLKAACRESGKRFNFRSKAEVVFSEFIPAQNDPTDFTQLSQLLQLYEAVECAEKHPRATLGREIEIALPNELSLAQQVELVRKFIAEVRQRFSAEQAFFDFSIHAKEDNAHAHICMSEREQLAPFVFDKTKRRDWDGESFVSACREIWQTQTNAALEQAEVNQRVDCRSHADRGLRVLPSFHEGKAAYFKSEVKQMNEIIKNKNQEIQAANDDAARQQQAATILQPAAFQHTITPCAMECADTMNPYTRLLLERQYGEGFPFSGSLSFVNLNDPAKAVLFFKDKSKVVDYGDRVESIGSTAGTAAERVIELALAKDWGAVSFSGDEAFLRAAFALAMEHGLNIVPKDEGQFHLLNEIRTGRRAGTVAAVSPMPVKSGKTPSNIPALGAIGDRLKKAAGKMPAPTKRRWNGI